MPVWSTSRRTFLSGLALLSAPWARAQSPRWQARWISVAGASAFEYGVYHFRRTFSLSALPTHFPVRVSADQRYELYVNGRRVARGPARGDLNHWRFETVDLAPYLQAGRNVAAAVVWNFGRHTPEAQQTYQTGFVLEIPADAPQEALPLRTGPGWKAWTNPAYSPLPVTFQQVRGYFVVGPGDRVEGVRYPWGWEQPGFDDTGWSEAVAGPNAGMRDATDSPSRWMLVPRPIPAMEEAQEPPLKIRVSEGATVSAMPFTVPAGGRVRLILDQGQLTTAYPELSVSGGKGTLVRLGYAESLFEKGARRGDKGNRGEVEGKEFIGYYDEFVLEGGQRRTYRPLWWRTFRFIEMTVQAASEPVSLEGMTQTFTAYPFDRKAKFSSPDPELDRILDVGWRTARLCAHETYEDCPYYEQLQYVGDTRVQALISLYMSGDDRLMRNAIELVNDSRTAEGATMSRAPTKLQQYIPAFSMWWIAMVHDHWMHRGDRDFLVSLLPGVRSVMGFFARYRKSNGGLHFLPWWRYFDWVNQWPRGEAPAMADGSSAPFDLLLLMTLDWCRDLELAAGSAARAAECDQWADQLRSALPALYWDEGRNLFADTPERKSFSQHTQSLAVLAGAVSGNQARELMERTVADPGLARCSFWFRFYLHAAMERAGLGDRYLEMLADWRGMLAKGMTTWAERADGSANASRSDCHAWSASPNIDLFRIVLGIEPMAPGFAHVRVKPHPGPLARASGSLPHPKGEVAVQWVREGERLRADVQLPEGVTGEFEWAGRVTPLRSGRNVLA
ncbi:MAG: family 78 glycoside hydrolase catalytic domain [Acidobacteria bacterium]|nr:family 78 glycoside hydrolase catalytic domain [Acidobacteriota bacterium]